MSTLLLPFLSICSHRNFSPQTPFSHNRALNRPLPIPAHLLSVTSYRCRGHLKQREVTACLHPVRLSLYVAFHFLRLTVSCRVHAGAHVTVRRVVTASASHDIPTTTTSAATASLEVLQALSTAAQSDSNLLHAPTPNTVAQTFVQSHLQSEVQNATHNTRSDELRTSSTTSVFRVASLP